MRGQAPPSTVLLKSLGSKVEYRMSNPKLEMLESFPNPHPDTDYDVSLGFPEFTSLCPKTGQPDFAAVRIKYVPAELCIETKSLKLYLFAYRQEGAFMEAITGRILRDLVEVLKPKVMRVQCDFNPRGGISLRCIASFIDGKFAATLSGEGQEVTP